MAPARKKQRLSNGNAEVEDNQEDRGTRESATQENGAKKEISEKQRRSLFVRSLPASATSESLTELFSESYPIKHATAVTDPATKQCRGFGFVTFADAEDAQRAREQFNGHTLEGRKIRVEIAQPRHRDVEKESAAEGAKAAISKREQRQQAPPQPSRLIVRNLPWTVKTPEQLEKQFLSFGKVKQAYIPKRGRGLGSGFGFVVMRGRKNAEKALESMNGKEVDGRTIAVDWAVEKEAYEALAKSGETQKEAEDDAESDGGSPIAQDGDENDDEEEDGGNVSMDDEEEDMEGVDEDDEEGMDDEEEEDDDDAHLNRTEDKSSTLFVRNLPFTCTDEDLEDHFAQFGNTRYARVVMDPNTARSKGTGFVCFFNKPDADACLRNAPARVMQPGKEASKDNKPAQNPSSVLQNEEADPTGQFSIDGRVLQVTRAVERGEANRLTEEGVAHRHKRNEDKRRLYLLQEGTISSKSKLWEQLSPTERNMRDASAKQRKTLIESNPSLHLSLTRLSIRNIPNSIDSKDLKGLAREAVVGFATDVKNGTRKKLSKEELSRGGEEMTEAEKARKKSGKGVVKQAKVVFEGASGGKVSEDSGAGRSRGYGFIEYHTHRSALMGLRWLNGHAIDYQVKDQQKNASKDEIQDRKKRLIVEFAIENAQVVKRRKESEQKARERSEAVQQGAVSAEEDAQAGANDNAANSESSRKRKRSHSDKGHKPVSKKGKPPVRADGKPMTEAQANKKEVMDEKTTKRNSIIGRKRALRRQKKGGK